MPLSLDPHAPHGGYVPPAGWHLVTAEATHPGARPETGALLRHATTGHYVLDVLGTLRSVPQAWARAQETAEAAATYGHLSDVELTKTAVAASGLSVTRYAEEVVTCDESTVRRWGTGAMALPAVVRRRMERDLLRAARGPAPAPEAREAR